MCDTGKVSADTKCYRILILSPDTTAYRTRGHEVLKTEKVVGVVSGIIGLWGGHLGWCQARRNVRRNGGQSDRKASIVFFGRHARHKNFNCAALGRLSPVRLFLCRLKVLRFQCAHRTV